MQIIAEHVSGIIFLGTPFAGSDAAKWGELVRQVFHIVKKTDQTTLRDLKEDSPRLAQLGIAFPETVRKRNETARKIKITFFYEQLRTYGVMVRSTIF